jgi:hypothetical protein
MDTLASNVASILVGVIIGLILRTGPHNESLSRYSGRSPLAKSAQYRVQPCRIRFLGLLGSQSIEPSLVCTDWKEVVTRMREELTEPML